MLGLSSSKSSSSADTTLDQSQRVSDQSQMTGFGLSNLATGNKSRINVADKSDNQGTMIDRVGGGKGSTTTLTMTETDHGAVAGAFDFARDMGGEAFGFGESALLAIDAAGQRTAQQADRSLGAIASLTESLKGGGASQGTILWLVGGTLAAVTVVVLAVTLGGSK